MVERADGCSLITRHTPRDAIELFRHLQDFADHEPLLAPEVKSGLRAYSRKYFLRELKDELAGYLPSQREIDRAIGVLTTLGKQTFTLAQLEAKREETGVGGIEIETLVRVLFECSAIGMVEEARHRRLYTFKYRNPNTIFIPSATLWAAPRGLKALNIEVGRQQRRPTVVDGLAKGRQGGP